MREKMSAEKERIIECTEKGEGGERSKESVENVTLCFSVPNSDS